MYTAKGFSRAHDFWSALVLGWRRCASLSERSSASALGHLVGVVLIGTLTSAATTAAENDWRYLGGNPHSNQYSVLDQINEKTIGSLGLLWYSDLPIGAGLVGNPLVMDNVVYQGGPYGSAVATDINTGKTLWSFVPNLGLGRYSRWAAYIATTNRSGLAIDDIKVYISGGCSLFGLDRKAGKQQWRAEICDPTGIYGSSSAPRVGAGKVFVGINNIQSGTGRGYALALDANTGKEIWRFYTVPGDPSKPFENKQMEMAAKTWGDEYWTDLPGGGSGSVWAGMIYDSKTDLLIFGAGNPGTDGYEEKYVDKKMLFTDSIIAVNASTGEYVWHRQLTTGDIYHPGDAVAHLQLADLKIKGRNRHVLLQAAKNGYFYVIDATTGKVISAKNYVPTVNYKPLDLKTGTLSFKDELRWWNYPGKAIVLQPGGYGV